LNTSWSDAALALFAARAIDPAVATAADVYEERGALLYRNGRYRPLDGHTLNTKGIPPAPLWVPQKPAEMPSLLLTEGETDALAAATVLTNGKAGPFKGLPILALPGCNYPRDSLTKTLRYYRTEQAFVCFDADGQVGGEARSAKGRGAAAKVRVALEASGIRAIPVELPDGFDLAAWLADGGDLPNALADAEAAYTRQRQGISFAEVEDEAIRWVWRRRVLGDRPTVIAADPGMGKSTWTCVLAAELSREGKTVLMANAEDPPPRVRARLVAAGADLSRVRPVDGLVLPDHTDRLREQALETGADLITIDPYNAYLADGINALRDQQVRHALAPLLSIATETGCGIVIVCHLNRGGDEEAPIYRIPVGVRGIAGSILMMQVEGHTTRLIHRKSNYGPLMEDVVYSFENGGLTENGTPEPHVERDGSTEVRDYSQMGVSGFDE
jgi:hypothetical protein